MYCILCILVIYYTNEIKFKSKKNTLSAFLLAVLHIMISIKFIKYVNFFSENIVILQ